MKILILGFGFRRVRVNEEDFSFFSPSPLLNTTTAERRARAEKLFRLDDANEWIREKQGKLL
jgi:hypothetical protein